MKPRCQRGTEDVASTAEMSTAASAGLPTCEPSVFNEIQMTSRLYGGMPIAIFGFLTNVINVVVFCDPEMRCSLVNHFLLVLSISDLLLLVCNFFMLIFPVISSMSNNVALHDYYPLFLWYSYPVGLSTQTCGVYLTVLVSVHRYLGVCHPFRAKRWVSGTPVKCAIIGSVIFSILINLHTWLELDVFKCYSPIFHDTIRSIKLTKLKNDASYNIITKCILYTLVMFVVPFITLIIVNWRIVVALKASTRMRNAHSSKKNTQSRLISNFRLLRDAKYSELFGKFGRLKFNPLKTPSLLKTNGNSLRDRSVTLMLLAIVAIFLCCNCLAFCNNIYEIVRGAAAHVASTNSTVSLQADDAAEELLREQHFDLSVEISNLLISLNSSSSMFVYLIFSSKYRCIIKHWLGLEKRKRVNGVALTTAMAAQKALELSILPDEVESRRSRRGNAAVFAKRRPRSRALVPASSENDLRVIQTSRRTSRAVDMSPDDIRDDIQCSLSRAGSHRTSSRRKLLRFSTVQ
ncbi:unnamed protein product [Caenorhabditis auriculariae]|uniref:G-protein coupled receptors family 1 profile domain-containing protein n=1 Tax=Caenorhabditis auriculariae TaxID=2777116 RepID=A0A8S1HET0_9PELO|nr:unnamed protein product [Caenorhabditis auriculariae]